MQFADKSFTTRELTPLAKRFMKDNMGAEPLGKPHKDESKLNYRVRSVLVPPRAISAHLQASLLCR